MDTGGRKLRLRLVVAADMVVTLAGVPLLFSPAPSFAHPDDGSAPGYFLELERPKVRFPSALAHNVHQDPAVARGQGDELGRVAAVGPRPRDRRHSHLRARQHSSAGGGFLGGTGGQEHYEQQTGTGRPTHVRDRIHDPPPAYGSADVHRDGPRPSGRSTPTVHQSDQVDTASARENL